MYKVEEFISKAYNLLIFAANYADYYYPKSDKRRVQLGMRRHPIAFLLKTLKKIKWGKLVSFDTIGNVAQAVIGKCNDEISYPICTSWFAHIVIVNDWISFGYMSFQQIRTVGFVATDVIIDFAFFIPNKNDGIFAESNIFSC